MKIYGIAAMTRDRIIGNGDKIPWRISDEFKFFRDHTMGHKVLMGRKTWDSLPKKPLPGRDNIVLSRNSRFFPEKGMKVIHDPEDVFNLQFKDGEDLYIIGGAEIYKLFLDMMDGFYISVIKESYKGDVRMPTFEHLFGNKDWLVDHAEFKSYLYY